jgi:hypothetical protein
VELKNTFMHEVNICESNLLSTVNKVIDNDEVKTFLENFIAINLKQMHGNISKTTQSIEVACGPKCKTVEGVNIESLISQDDAGKTPSLSYKILIAEPSNLFANIIDEIFTNTVFKY